MKTSAPRRMPLSKRTVELVADGLDDARQGVERGDRAVELAAAVVRDDHGRGAVVDGLPGVVGVQDALQDDRQAGRCAELRQVGPGPRGVGEDLAEVFERLDRVQLRAADGLAEDRVARVVGQPLAAGGRADRRSGCPARATRAGRCRASRPGPSSPRPRPGRGSWPSARRAGASRAGTSGGSRPAPWRRPPSSPTRRCSGPSATRGLDAARATASSACLWRIDCTPIGASRTGAGSRWPRISTERSRRSTSRRNRGTIRHRRKASRLARIVSSPPAPPAR